MNEADRKAFTDALIKCSARRFTNAQDFQAGWIACRQWRDSQVSEPVAEVTHNNTNCIGWNPKFNPLAIDDKTPLYITSPSAQINEQITKDFVRQLDELSNRNYQLRMSNVQMREALERIADSDGDTHVFHDIANAVLAVVKEQSA